MTFALRLESAVVILLMVLSSPAQTTDPEWINVQLNRDATSQLQNEEQIAINPTDPDNMVAVWRDFRLGYRKVGWAYTFDGGETWTEGGLIPETHYAQQSDPGITADSDGNFYAIVLSYTGSTTQPNGLIVLKSTDGGVTWGAPLPVVSGVPNVFEDKEFIACDRTNGRHEGNLYVTWARFGSTVDIMARWSPDSGRTWSNTLAVSDRSSVQFPIPVVGRDGEVYIAWTSYANSAIMLDVSTNGGASFGVDRQVVRVHTVSTVLEWGINAYSSPHMDADISNSAYSGRLYIAFMDRRDGNEDFDIWVTSSDNMGVTWTTPIRINDDTPGNGLDQFHPWLTVDNTGVVTVVWLDRRHDSQNRTYHCYISQSTDGGVTWSPNVQISEEPSDPANAFRSGMSFEKQAGDTTGTKHPYRSVPTAGLLGEYIGVVSWNGVPTPVWTDIRNLNQDVFAAYLKGSDVEWPTPADLARGLVIVPNPVRPRQRVTVWSGLDGLGILTIHDAMGRTIKEIDNILSEDGRLTFNSEEIDQVPSGVYFLRLTTSSGTSDGRLMLLD